MRPGYLPSEDIAAFFRRAALVAYPSYEEGFGLPALEGLACGAPVVTTAGSALGEVVDDAALLVAPGDEVALAAAMATVLDDPAVAARLRAAGPVRAAAFTWERCVDRHLEAYERAAVAGARA
jgi:glycosyltransferase involved in cell wall biosynthesis